MFPVKKVSCAVTCNTAPLKPEALAFMPREEVTKVIPLYCLQNPPPFELVEEHIFNMYERMYKKYLTERSFVPRGNLVEVKYEDFVNDPVPELERIYRELGFSDYASFEKRFHAYMLAQSEIHPRKYTVSNEVRKKVVSHWQFAFDAFGYDPTD